MTILLRRSPDHRPRHRGVAGGLAVLSILTGAGPERAVAQSNGEGPAPRIAALSAQEPMAEQWRRVQEWGGAETVVTACESRLAGDRSDPNWFVAAEPGRGWLRISEFEQIVQLNRSAPGSESIRALDTNIDPHPLSAITDLHEQLREHGIELLFIAIPVRVQVYPELLIPDLDVSGFPGAAPGATQLLLELERRGVSVLDLTTPFVEQREFADRDELFLYANTHWTPRGAQLAAAAVAKRIRDQEWFEPGTFAEGADYRIESSVLEFATPNWEPPPGARAQRLQMEAVLRPQGPLPAVVESRESPIVVLGDSFVQFYGPHGCSFDAHLACELGQRLDVVANRGGGVKTCRDSLRRRRDDLAGKKSVIWMLPMPSLLPDRQWKKIPLFSN